MDRCWAADSTCPPASPWSHCQDRAQRRGCQHRVRPGTAAWGGMDGAQGGKRSRVIHGRWHFPAAAQGMWERTKRAFSAAGDVPGTGVGWGWMGAECLQPSCPIPLHLSHPVLPHPVPCNPLSSHPSPSYPTPSHPNSPTGPHAGQGRMLGCWVWESSSLPHRDSSQEQGQLWGSVGLGGVVGPHHAVGSKWGPTVPHQAWSAGRGRSEPIVPVAPGRAHHPREGSVPAALAPQRSPSAPTTMRSTSTARMGPSGAKSMS